MPGGQSGSTLGASLVVLDKSTGTSISGSDLADFFTCLTGVITSFLGVITWVEVGKENLTSFFGDFVSGFKRLSMENGKNLAGVASILLETLKTSVGVGGGELLYDKEVLLTELDGDGVHLSPSESGYN